MAKRVKRLGGAEVRLLLAAVLCAGFFIASTGVEEWCSTCYPHKSAELTIINDAGTSVEVTLSGPVSRKMAIFGWGQKQVTIQTRVGFYGYSYGEEIYDFFLNMSRFEIIDFGQLYVAPEVKNRLILKPRRRG